MLAQYLARHCAGVMQTMRPLLFFFFIIGSGRGARILALFGHTGKSHFVFFEPLLKTLAERGHNVTVASFFPQKHPPNNYEDVSFVGVAEVGLETFNVVTVENQTLFHKIPFIGEILKQTKLIHQFGNLAVSLCERIINWPPLVEALKRRYDLVILESFNSDCMLGMLHAFGIKVPIVSLSSSNLVPWALPRLGLVDNPSYLPVMTTPLTSSMTLVERMQNTIMNIYTNVWFHRFVQRREREFIEESYEMDVPLYELSLNLSLIIVNTFYPLNGVRDFVPALVEVGGLHLNRSVSALPTVGHSKYSVNSM